MRDQRCSGDVAEEWRDVVGYEGFYQVSNLGRVRSLPRKKCKGKVLSLRLHEKYYDVLLSVAGQSKRHRVHRLVAAAFIPNPDNLPEVNHIDGNGGNNSVSNLEWCDRHRNHHHAIENGLRNHEPWLRACHESCKVKVIRSDGLVFESVRVAAESLGVSSSCVSACLRGRAKRIKGYSFSYYEEETV